MKKTALLGILLVACGPRPVATAVGTPPKVAPENHPLKVEAGKVDLSLIGDYALADGSSSLSLKPDGTYVQKSKTSASPTKAESVIAGKWATQGPNLILKQNKGFVGNYPFELKDRQLILKPAAAGAQGIVYLRK